MKAYILKTKRRITPFNRTAARVYSPFVNFSSLLKEELSLARLQIRDVSSISEIDKSEPSLLIPDYVFVTSPLIRKFLFLCKNSPNRLQRLSVIKSKLTDYYTSLMDIDVIDSAQDSLLSFDIFYLPKGFVMEGAESIDVQMKRLGADSINIKVSQNFGIRLERMSNVRGSVFFEEFPITDEIVGHQRFWFHSLLMNVLYLNTFRERILSGEFSFGFLRGFKFLNEGNIKNSIIGSNVWLHPTAVVENSLIADNVKIGARVVIRDSVIMKDCNIGDSNIIRYSLFGERVVSLSNSLFRCSVISPGSTVSNLGFCYSMLGEGSFLTTAVIFLYEGIDSTIKIKKGGEELETNRYFLGSASGELSVLGTRAIVSPGMEIPSETIIVLRPEEGVMKIPHLIEGEYYIWDNATIKRFDEIFTGFDKNDFI
ncbi:MAG: hypothetical protein ACP5QK_08885 [Myxococcota bacterium]